MLVTLVRNAWSDLKKTFFNNPRFAIAGLFNKFSGAGKGQSNDANLLLLESIFLAVVRFACRHVARTEFFLGGQLLRNDPQKKRFSWNEELISTPNFSEDRKKGLHGVKVDFTRNWQSQGVLLLCDV